MSKKNKKRQASRKAFQANQIKGETQWLVGKMSVQISVNLHIAKPEHHQGADFPQSDHIAESVQKQLEEWGKNPRLWARAKLSDEN